MDSKRARFSLNPRLATTSTFTTARTPGIIRKTRGDTPVQSVTSPVLGMFDLLSSPTSYISSPSPPRPSPSSKKNTSRSFAPSKVPSLLKPDTFVTFIVGKDEYKQTFVVHKSFATSKSPFFDKAFNGAFMEGGTQEMKLEDLEGEVFGYVTHWIYYDNIVEVPDYSTVPKDKMMLLAKLWVMAGRFIMPMLQNQAMKALVAVHRHRDFDQTEMKSFVTYAYGAGSKELKTLAVDCLAWKATSSVFHSLIYDLPKEVQVDVMVTLRSHSMTLSMADRGKLREMKYLVEEN